MIECYKVIFYLIGKILPKNDQMIIFESFLGKQYSDNPRAIYEYLKKHYPHYKMYWSIEKNSLYKIEQLDIQYVQRFSLKWMILMNRAKYWVSNSRLPLWLPKPYNTVYVQTWHGTPLKRLATDMEEVHMPSTHTKKYKNNFVKEAKKWDYLISPNEYSTEIFKRAFQFDKKIIESGYPRNDYIVNNNNEKVINQIKQHLNIPLNKKVILYAPTWRDNHYYGPGRYKFDLEIDLNLLKKEISEDYIIVLRMHYLIADDLDLTRYDRFVYDLSFYEDIRDLYLIADILITDYSSVFFDYATLLRPMIFYVYDIEEYRDFLRGFYIDFEEQAPGPLVKTTKEVIDEIRKIEKGYTDYNKIKEFAYRFSYLEDGKSTERVVSQLNL